MANVLLIIGVIAIINGGIFMGALTSGSQQRANYHTETKEDRLLRLKVGRISVLVGVLVLLLGLILHVIL
ncbi:hypothetical protein CHI12_06950 [Terribacillus saccharophilus]|jgi:hypothetical protein|uniref:Uncharacterized protein n=1 Tax=Terribacillus saccharophilus TaxID=361277 RepID=A0A268HEH5_9BACI|nr:DUF5316 family protein [Terribacillus saccharophilus]PAD34757.1 hypothetical protein CHH56_13295 [Terribacillus saccharophilus]PAD95505.1 hypothetical protein CHH50_13530 [Terribacillus saccharophilus]PAD99083.1 hypothetical protein CHH48_14425 [Terribacillus saccharophilus]PAE08274.1 hypothetical protein CHI12_06950 [Terribacillus saccharophilus]